MQLKDATYIIRSINEMRAHSLSDTGIAGAEQIDRHLSSMRGGVRKVLRIIEQAPVIDAVPVTRCKNCEHQHTVHCPMVYEDLDYTGTFVIVRDNSFNDNGFCHRGTPKKGETSK